MRSLTHERRGLGGSTPGSLYVRVTQDGLSSGEGTLILISGLPRSGKTSLADALAASGFTHVPLDRYIRRMPAATTFLDWVASPTCIDWPLVSQHLDTLSGGRQLVAPSGWGPTWGEGGLRMGAADSGPQRLMKPSSLGYAVPGCYAFDLASSSRQVLRVFASAPRRTIAERALGRPVPGEDVDLVLDEQLSANWREIEKYAKRADVVVSGLDAHEVQVEAVLMGVDRGKRLG